MTDSDYGSDDQDQDEGESVRNQRKRIKDLEAENKDLAAKAQANEQAAKRVAFMDAGIPDTPQSRFFRENYQGEMSKEAITQSAAEYGFLPEQSAQQAAELNEIDGQSRAAMGGDQALIEGSDAEMNAEIDRLAAMPDGSKLVANYLRSHGRIIASDA